LAWCSSSGCWRISTSHAVGVGVTKRQMQVDWGRWQWGQVGRRTTGIVRSVCEVKRQLLLVLDCEQVNRRIGEQIEQQVIRHHVFPHFCSFS